jgi:predicted negative regulator of RcsB-dependent stress response
MNRSFSKILTLITFIILAGGGFFAWQYFGTPKQGIEEETKKILIGKFIEMRSLGLK